MSRWVPTVDAPGWILHEGRRVDLWVERGGVRGLKRGLEGG